MVNLRNTAKKPSVRLSFVEQKWKSIFQLVEKGRLRRGKAAVKQLEMVKVSSTSKATCFSVRSAGFGAGVYEVTLPMFVDESLQLPKVARFFLDRPDWLAACLDGKWDSEFLQRIEAVGIQLFPDEDVANQLKWSVRCTCQDFDPFCVHVVTVLTKLMLQMEAKPLLAFAWAGMPVEDLLNLTHVLSHEMMMAKLFPNDSKQNDSKQNEVTVENSPQAVSAFKQIAGNLPEILHCAGTIEVARGRFIPTLDQERLKNLQVEYALQSY